MASQPNNSNALGLKFPIGDIAHAEQRVSYVTPQHALRRILNFTGHSIDDVVNSRVAHRKVLVYYRIHKMIHRRTEITESRAAMESVGVTKDPALLSDFPASIADEDESLCG